MSKDELMSQEIFQPIQGSKNKNHERVTGAKEKGEKYNKLNRYKYIITDTSISIINTWNIYRIISLLQLKLGLRYCYT